MCSGDVGRHDTAVAMIQVVSGRVFALNFSFLLHFESTQMCVTWCTACKNVLGWIRNDRKREKKDGSVYRTPKKIWWKISTTIYRMCLRQVVSATFSTLPSLSCRLLSLAKCLFNIEARWKEEKKTLFALKFNLFLSCFGRAIVLHVAMSLGTYWKIVEDGDVSWFYREYWSKERHKVGTLIWSFEPGIELWTWKNRNLCKKY